MKAQRKDKRKDAKSVGQRGHSKSATRSSASCSNLSEDEIQRLRRPEIDIEQWRKGEPVLAAKLERIARQVGGPEVANSEGRRSILDGKARLRKLIAGDPHLVKAFAFFTKKLEWEPEGLLQLLYWHCNMMHATPQVLLALERSETWPISRKILEKTRSDTLALAKTIATANGMNWHPGDFDQLPEILHSYASYLDRELRFRARRTNSVEWARQRFEWARQTSVYERIRAKAGKHHAVRLHRLVNAARRAQNLSPVKWRAFVKWLNELRKSQERAKLQPSAEPK